MSDDIEHTNKLQQELQDHLDNLDLQKSKIIKFR